MLHLGIDASLTATGVCILENGQPVAYEEFLIKKLRGTARLFENKRRLLDFMGSQKFDGIAIEGPSYDSIGRHVDIGELHGTIKLCLFEKGYENLLIPTPTQLKKYACGTANIPSVTAKEIVLRSIALEFGLDTPTLTHNTADALVLAKICYDFQREALPRSAARQAVIKALKKPPKKKPLRKKNYASSL